MKKVLFSVFICIGFLSVRAQEIPAWKLTDLRNYLQKEQGVLVVNFWATFCKPCMEEMPHLLSLAEKYRNKDVKLLLVNLDMSSQYPKKLKRFVKKNRISATVVWLDETNADIFCPAVDPKWSGSIPATLFLNSVTGYRRLAEGEMDATELEKAIIKAIEARL